MEKGIQGSEVMYIKICGITEKKEIDRLLEEKVDYAGFVVFFPKSRRNNDINHAKEILAYVAEKKQSGHRLKTVAVTVSPEAKEIEAIENAGFDVIQIHGNLSHEVRDKIKLPIWRAFNLDNYDDNDKNRELSHILKDEKIEGIVFDGANYGSGETFNWDSFNGINTGDKYFIMAGGLTPENVADAINVLHPDMVDVSSGVEFDDKSIKGKDPDKISRFVKQVRNGKKEGYEYE